MSYIDLLWPEIEAYVGDIRASAHDEGVCRRLVLERFALSSQQADEVMKRFRKAGK